MDTLFVAVLGKIGQSPYPEAQIPSSFLVPQRYWKSKSGPLQVQNALLILVRGNRLFLARAIVQHLRVLAALREDLGLIPSIHVVDYNLL